MTKKYIKKLNEINIEDIELVGGKNASLGEMIGNLTNLGIKVPDGFATTSDAYRDFIEHNNLGSRINKALENLDIKNINDLTKTGKQVRDWILESELPEKLVAEIKSEWNEMSNNKDIAVAIRSSATAEDLPDASFAGQQETYLNIKGFDNIIKALHNVFASLYTDRAIAYRIHQGFDHSLVALSVGIQHMVRSDIGASGVMFTLDTESGFRDAIFITSSYGLGETVVQGSVNPDEFYVYKEALKKNKHPILRKTLGDKSVKMILGKSNSLGKTVEIIDVDKDESKQFSINDDDITELAQSALLIEEHYGRPMDIEWGKDGSDGKIYILQARPETVQSRSGNTINRYTLKAHSSILASGRSIGQKIGSGTAKIIHNINEMHRIQDGDVLISDMTDPDWEPVMKKASAIVTNRGGRTCHAAIIARELGIPAVVGCNNATKSISDGESVTVSCAEGDEGFIYEGVLEFEEQHIKVDSLPEIPVKIMMNVGNPDRAFSFSSIPNHGVGLARLEFIINRMVGIHPKALLQYDKMDKDIQSIIDEQMAGYDDPIGFFITKLSEGIGTIAAAFSPKPV
ncbi:MAG: phosphoenolpyruvate synthase, partial [Pseudomonadota bacterium]|nr:phosphoenolpyruvate synthase [Pseudomonadota bacterium]